MKLMILASLLLAQTSFAGMVPVAKTYRSKILSLTCMNGEIVKPASCQYSKGKLKNYCSIPHIGSELEGNDAITQTMVDNGTIKFGYIGTKQVGTFIESVDTSFVACDTADGKASKIVISVEMIDEVN